MSAQRDELRRFGEQLHQSTRRLVAMWLPHELTPRRERMMWLLVALYCEVQDTAEDDALDDLLAEARRVSMRSSKPQPEVVK